MNGQPLSIQDESLEIIAIEGIDGAGKTTLMPGAG